MGSFQGGADAKPDSQGRASERRLFAVQNAIDIGPIHIFSVATDHLVGAREHRGRQVEAAYTGISVGFSPLTMRSAYVAATRNTSRWSLP